MAKTIANKNIQAELKARTDAGIFDVVGEGAPVSGNTGEASGYNVCGMGSFYTDVVSGMKYVNEGTAVNLYWTPVSLLSSAYLSWVTDFRDGLGKAISDTAATATISGSGIRVFGQGIAETDSGLTVAIGENGPIASLITTDEAAHLAAIGVGITTSVPYQPDQHGPIVVEALVAMSAAITLRSLFIGFLGTVADALDPPVTGAATTLTLVQDDLAGLVFDAGLTDADGLFMPSNKSDAAASQTTASCDTGESFPAAGTYCLLRVEVLANGTMKCYKDKILIGTVVAALDVDEEVAPCLLVRSTSAATKTMLVKFFRTWGFRDNG